MKKIITTLAAAAVVLSCGLSYGRAPEGPNFEQLKGYAPMIGTWRYEGQLHEDVRGIAKKGGKLKFQFSWRWILGKNNVEENWSIEFEGGKKLTGKALIGWDAARNRIVYGGMNSLGGMSLGTVVFDSAAKTSTLTAKGISGTGEKTSFEGVVTKTGKETLTWQALQQEGGLVEGPSAKYTFQRVKRPRQRKVLKQAK